MTAIPYDLVNIQADDNGDVSEDDFEILGDYYEAGTNGIQSASLRTGYGARLSAPGYMDCTEWTVFDTEAEAQDYLDENYPEDDESEED